MEEYEEQHDYKKIEINESKLLSDLIKNSPEFKNFYENERTNIKKPIIWVKSSDLSPEEQLQKRHLARAFFFPTGEIVAIIRNNPCKLQDSSIIAHELAHFIFKEEGYPQVGHNHHYDDDRGIKLLAFTFNNAIQDPLVIKKMLSYGYDLKDEYLLECKELNEALKNPTSPKSELEEIYFAFSYLQSVLENRLLFGNEKTECSKNIETIYSKLNSVGRKGKKMLKIVDKHGIESPDSVRKIYEDIINSFSLNDYMIIYP